MEKTPFVSDVGNYAPGNPAVSNGMLTQKSDNIKQILTIQVPNDENYLSALDGFSKRCNDFVQSRNQLLGQAELLSARLGTHWTLKAQISCRRKHQAVYLGNMISTDNKTFSRISEILVQSSQIISNVLI
jgi:hypothetical protein